MVTRPECMTKQSLLNRHHPQDGPWAWLVLLVAWLSNVLVGGITFAIAVVLPTLREYFGKSRQQSAWIAAIAIAVIQFMGPVTGLLNNRFGCRVTVILGAILCSTGLLITSFAKHLEFIYFSYGMVFGCGGSFINLTSFLVVTKFFKKWQPLAVGIVAGGVGCGNLVLSPSVEVLLSEFGWRNLFRILAGMVAVLIILTCVYGPKQGEHTDENRCQTELVAENEHKRRMFDCSVWTNYRWILVTLAAGFAYIAKAIGQVNLAQHAKDIGVAEKDFARLYLFMGVSSVIARPASGLLCRTEKVKALFLLQTAIAVLGISFLVLPILTSYRLMVVFVVLFGAGDGGLVTCLFVCVLKCFSKRVKRNSATGLSTFWVSFAVFIGPPLSGHMADVYGTFTPSFFLAGAFCMLAVVIICFIPCLKKKNDQLQGGESLTSNRNSNKQIVLHESTV